MPRGAVKSSKPKIHSEGWWDNAYLYHDHINVQYELEFGKDIIKPGNPIKIKHHREIFKFRCLAHNITTDTTWIDCLAPDGQWRSFRVEQLKCLVKPKRSRRTKPQA